VDPTAEAGAAATVAAESRQGAISLRINPDLDRMISVYLHRLKVQQFGIDIGPGAAV